MVYLSNIFLDIFKHFLLSFLSQRSIRKSIQFLGGVNNGVCSPAVSLGNGVIAIGGDYSLIGIYNLGAR